VTGAAFGARSKVSAATNASRRACSTRAL
jgi:hypothetical protein